MAAYEYVGVDKKGKQVSGTLEAPTDGEMRMKLRSQGVRPLRVKRIMTVASDSKGATNIFQLFSSKTKTSASITAPIDQLVIFTRQLQVMIGAGIPLVQGLEILGEQQAHAGLKRVLTEVREKVQAGGYLWEALAGYPLCFPKLYVSLIRAGESSGSLDTILKRLSRYLEDADRLRKLLKSAMMYPIVVISIAVGVVSLMMIFVIPKFEEMLSTGGQELPGPTKLVIDLSHFLVNNVVFIIIGAIALGVGLKRYITTVEGKAALDRVIYNMPVFGELTRKAGIARFSRTMNILLGAGINLLDGIEICKMTIGNVVLEDAVGTLRGEVEAGKTLGSVVARLSVFPRMAVQMISVGENTGSLDKMLEKVADFYEAEVETMVGGLTKLIEPLLLVFLGGTVGGIMIAMYLPIFKMAGGVS